MPAATLLGIAEYKKLGCSACDVVVYFRSLQHHFYIIIVVFSHCHLYLLGDGLLVAVAWQLCIDHRVLLPGREVTLEEVAGVGAGAGGPPAQGTSSVELG